MRYLHAVSRAPAFGALTLLVVAWGCDADRGRLTGPIRITQSQSGPGIEKWACEDESDPHCLSPDPNDPPSDPDPDAPGIWLNVDGQTMSPQWCSANANDVDDDGAADFCEYRLAYTFRPQMVSFEFDDVSGEPYYAVQPMFRQSPRLKVWRIIYLLAYYEDFGDHTPIIDSPGHIGDSEFIVLDLGFNTITQHWELQFSLGSAHYGTETDGSDWTFFPGVQFPGKERVYPRLWVSKSKHANYHTRSQCNSGAVGADDCSEPTVRWRVPVNRFWNIGSSWSPAPDVPFGVEGNDYTCVRSRDYTRRILMGFTGRECFWREGDSFAGWRPVATMTRPYAGILNDFGFGP